MIDLEKLSPSLLHPLFSSIFEQVEMFFEAINKETWIADFGVVERKKISFIMLFKVTTFLSMGYGTLKLGELESHLEGKNY